MIINIDYNKLKKIYVKGVRHIAEDEVFYAVPNACKYAFSNYSRLYEYTCDELSKQRWHEVEYKYSFRFHSDAYNIVFDNNEQKNVSVNWLIKTVFMLPPNTFLELKNFSKEKNRYALNNIYVFSKSEFTSFILARCNRKEKDISWVDNEIDLPISVTNLQRFLSNAYDGMMRRGSNESYKRHNPQYNNTTICSEWYKHPDVVKRYILDNIYYYPNCTLIMDKDLMTFGEGNEYAPGKAIPLPKHLNTIFRRSNRYRITRKRSGLYDVAGFGEYNSYEEALQAARNLKSHYLLSVANDEEQKGYLPDFMIAQIRQWAYKCRNGDIKIWEPSEEILKEKGAM